MPEKHECQESEGKIKFIKIKEDLKNYCEDCGKELRLDEIL